MRIGLLATSCVALLACDNGVSAISVDAGDQDGAKASPWLARDASDAVSAADSETMATANAPDAASTPDTARVAPDAAAPDLPPDVRDMSDWYPTIIKTMPVIDCAKETCGSYAICPPGSGCKHTPCVETAFKAMDICFRETGDIRLTCASTRISNVTQCCVDYLRKYPDDQCKMCDPLKSVQDRACESAYMTTTRPWVSPVEWSW